MITRRSFLAGVGAGCVGALAGAGGRARAEESPFEAYDDPVTGARVRVLTNNDFQDQVTYQTHPQWSKDQSLLLYTSRRGEAWLPTVLDMATGASRPLLDKPAADVLDVDNNRLLYVQDR
jgi:hypothetical protein